jgi:hypothetical protein
MQEIICVLDKSGSMHSVATDAVGGFNAFLKAQKEVPIPANITVCWFDDGFKVGYEGDLKSAPDVSSWPNGGMTALFDAIGKAFKHTGDRFAKENPEKVILAILTDGFENASKEFSKDTVANLIKEHREKYGWEVVFLAADQDAWELGAQLNISAGSTYSYSSKDTTRGFDQYTKSVISCRI